jgi:metal-responsive CopG/Arc/MetJ family transcriptional regulator
VADEWAETEGEQVATLTLIYDPPSPRLVQKLVELQHDSPAHIEATLHIHLDHTIVGDVAIRGLQGVHELVNVCAA